MDGVTVEQLIQEIPGRLQNALKTLNETLSAKESQLQSYQVIHSTHIIISSVNIA